MSGKSIRPPSRRRAFSLLMTQLLEDLPAISKADSGVLPFRIHLESRCGGCLEIVAAAANELLVLADFYPFEHPEPGERQDALRGLYRLDFKASPVLEGVEPHCRHVVQPFTGFHTVDSLGRNHPGPVLRLDGVLDEVAWNPLAATFVCPGCGSHVAATPALRGAHENPAGSAAVLSQRRGVGFERIDFCSAACLEKFRDSRAG